MGSIKKDFWRKSTVAVVGGGSWGTVLAQIVAEHCAEVRLWVREEERAREINATKSNVDYVPDLHLRSNIKALSDGERIFEQKPQLIIWALPSDVSREWAIKLAPFINGDEFIIHATKGIEPTSFKRMSEVLSEELPCRRIGVISGPNLALEIARSEPAAAVVASNFEEVREAGKYLFTNPAFGIQTSEDVIGVEWAGTLKNILAIAAGIVEGRKLGWNTRSLLLTLGLGEMVRLGQMLGAKPETFFGLAGVGDVLATSSSDLSRNFRVGLRIAQGEPLLKVLEQLGSTAEGVRTARLVAQFAKVNQVFMPVTQAISDILSLSESESADSQKLVQAIDRLFTEPLGWLS